MRRLSTLTSRRSSAQILRGYPGTSAGGGIGIGQKAGDGHGADAAGHGGDPARDRDGLIEGDVADDAGFALGRLVRIARADAVDADVDDGGPRLDPVAPDH